MSNLKFHLKEKSRSEKVFLVIEYMGGDADTEHFQEEELEIKYKDIKYGDISDQLELYKNLQKALRMDNAEYDDVKEEWGEDIADMWDNAPNDPQTDYSTKTTLDSVILRGYDDKGNMYQTYNLLTK